MKSFLLAALAITGGLFLTGCDSAVDEFTGAWNVRFVFCDYDHEHDHIPLDPETEKCMADPRYHMDEGAKFFLKKMARRVGGTTRVRMRVAEGHHDKVIAEAFNGTVLKFYPGTEEIQRCKREVAAKKEDRAAFMAVQNQNQMWLNEMRAKSLGGNWVDSLQGEIQIPKSAGSEEKVAHDVIITQCILNGKTILQVVLEDGSPGAHGGKAHAEH